MRHRRPATGGPDRTPLEIRGIEVILTSACNLRCAYCYQDRRRAARMSWETLKEAVDLLCRTTRPQVVLNFFGGEPLLEFDLLRRAVAHAEQVLPPGTGRQYGLCTNGTMLDDEKLAFLSSRAVDVQLSFDGVARAQERRAPGSYGRLDGLLDRIRTSHPSWYRERFSVAITLTGRNLSDLADSVDYFLAKDVREIGVSPVVTHDLEWNGSGPAELDHQWARIYRSSLVHRRKTGRTPVVALRRHRSPASPRGAAGATCSAGRGLVPVVDVDGTLWSCSLFCGSYQGSLPGLLKPHAAGLTLGKVGDPGLDQRLREFPERARATGLFHRSEPRHSGLGRCEECDQRQQCAICPVSIAHIPANVDPLRVPDMQCAFQRVIGKWRDRFPAQPATGDLLRGRVAAPEGVQRVLRAVYGSDVMRR